MAEEIDFFGIKFGTGRRTNESIKKKTIYNEYEIPLEPVLEDNGIDIRTIQTVTIEGRILKVKTKETE